MLYLGWLQACFHSFDSWHRDGHFMQDKTHLPLRFPCQIFHAVSGNKGTYKWMLLLKNKAWLNPCILQQKAHHSCPVLVPLSQCHPQVPVRQSCSSPHVLQCPSWAEGGSGGAAARSITFQPLTQVSVKLDGLWIRYMVASTRFVTCNSWKSCKATIQVLVLGPFSLG